MNIPGKLKVMGKTFTVHMVEALTNGDGRATSGQCRVATLDIWLSSSCPQQTRDACVLHETLEAIDVMNELGLTHHQICVLEENLYQVLRDNKLHFDE